MKADLVDRNRARLAAMVFDLARRESAIAWLNLAATGGREHGGGTRASMPIEWSRCLDIYAARST